MPTVQSILQKKGAHVHSIDGDATVLQAAQTMNENRVGALVVTQGDKVVGIFTERDIMCRIVALQRNAAEVNVADVMTKPVACCVPETTRAECRAVMRSKRIRHLPVVENERLVGIVSIGDILQDVEETQKDTIQYLYEYMYGEWNDQ